MKLRHESSEVLAIACPNMEYVLHGNEIKPLKTELVIKSTGKSKLVKEGLEILNNHPHPTEEQLEAAQLELDEKSYIRKREKEYVKRGLNPIEFIKAFIEKEEGDSTKWDELMNARKQVQDLHPAGSR